MNWTTLAVSLGANAGVLFLLLKLFGKALSQRMLANLNAQHEKDLEYLKAKYAESLAGYEHELDKSKRDFKRKLMPQSW